MRHIFGQSAPLPDSPLIFEDPAVKVGLVLTGGGSHGAFTWGALDAILPHLSDIDFVTGTSAGGCNATVMASGLNAGGVREAIDRLDAFWTEVGENGHLFGKSLRLLDGFLPQKDRWPNFPDMSFSMMTAFQSVMPSLATDMIARTVRDVIPDWENTVQHGKVGVSINTVLQDMLTGRTKHVHLTKDLLTPDGVGASAALKTLGIHTIKDHPSPLFRGKRCLDGAYHENGSLQPHLDAGVTDIVMIILHDRRHDDPHITVPEPIKHTDIHTQVLSLMESDTHKPVRVHAIEIESLGGEIGGLSHINDTSKMNCDPEFLHLLRDAGFAAGQKWVDEKLQYIGVMSSYDIYQPAFQKLDRVHACV